MAVNMNLNLRYGRLRGAHNVIAISTVERPRWGKTLLEKQKMIFRDALSDDNMYQKRGAAFLKGQPKAWEMIVRAMLALEMKNWVICGDSIDQALDFCVKREEDRNTAQQIRGNIRLKTLREADALLRDVVQGQASVDLTNRREQCMRATEVFLDDLHRHIMRARAKAIKGSGTAARPNTDRNVYLPVLLQTWQRLAKTDTAAWLSHENEHQRQLLKKLGTKCGLGLDTPRTDNDKRTWTARAEQTGKGRKA